MDSVDRSPSTSSIRAVLALAVRSACVDASSALSAFSCAACSASTYCSNSMSASPACLPVATHLPSTATYKSAGSVSPTNAHHPSSGWGCTSLSLASLAYKPLPAPLILGASSQPSTRKSCPTVAKPHILALPPMVLLRRTITCPSISLFVAIVVVYYPL